MRDIIPISEMRGLIKERTGASLKAGGGFFILNPKVNDILDKFCLTGPDGVKHIPIKPKGLRPLKEWSPVDLNLRVYFHTKLLSKLPSPIIYIWRNYHHSIYLPHRHFFIKPPLPLKYGNI